MTVQSAAMTIMPPTMEPRMIHVLAENAEVVDAVSVLVGAVSPAVVVMKTVGFLLVDGPVFVAEGGGVTVGVLVATVLVFDVLEAEVLLAELLEAESVDAVFVLEVFDGFELSDVLEALAVSEALVASDVLAVAVFVFVAAPVVPVPSPPPRIGIPPCLLIFLTNLSFPI